MQFMVLSRESIFSVYKAVTPVRPLFATSSFSTIPVSTLSLSSVLLCAARAARAVFDLFYSNLRKVSTFENKSI